MESILSGNYLTGNYSGKGITVKILNREIVRKITIYGKDWNHEKGR